MRGSVVRCRSLRALRVRGVRCLVLGCLVLACLVGLPLPARAQGTAEVAGPKPGVPSQPDAAPLETPSDADTPEARAVRFLEGLAKDRFNEAVLREDRALLEQALDALRLGMLLSPAPGFVFNAALVERRLGHCHAAAELFQRFLALPVSDRSRERAQLELAALDDCKEIESDALISVVPDVEIGLHEAGVRVLANGTVVRWDELLEGPAPSSGPELADVAFWSLAGASAVCAVVAGISIGQAWSAHEELQSPPSDADGDHLARVQKDGESAQTRARVFGVLTAGFGLGAGGVYWWSHRGSSDLQGASSRFQLVAEPNALGAAWRGRF